MKTMIKYILWMPMITAMVACVGDNEMKEERPYQGPVAPASLFERIIGKHKVKPDDIKFVKDLRYDQYTLEDVYPYKDTTRRFQWNKIRNSLVVVENAELGGSSFGFVRNRKNVSGEAALVEKWERNAYNNVADMYGTEKYQSAPLYSLKDTITPVRYATDGSWMRIEGEQGSFTKVFYPYLGSEWYIPTKFLKKVDAAKFDKVVCVDRLNQNICTLERTDSAWMVRSMNPATTGVHNPPYAHETPLGIFVVQEKKPKMYYLVDGTSRMAGYAPWASRFSNGGYTHGVPTNDPNGPIIEYSWTLGSTPRSHMCVRNASSHAKFIYDFTPVGESLVIVIE